MNILDIHTEASQAAKNAVGQFLTDWRSKTGGNEYGEPMYCGFAWVDVNVGSCLLYTSPSPRDLSTSRMPSSA